jgi:PLAT/LH2 domain
MARPFYLIGHNTNSIEEITEGLDKGLNAFEIDVNKDENNQLFVHHDPVMSQLLTSQGIPLPPRLVPFLQQLRQVADTAGPRMALVIFDCKIDNPGLAVELMNAVRTHLTNQGTQLWVIYSVPFIDHARTFFPLIQGKLTDHEGLMIDEEDNPAAVARFFLDTNVSRGCYGDGITTLAGIGLPSPNLVTHMDVAVAFSALANLKFVYPWVLVTAAKMAECIRIGSNGAMVDTGNTATLLAVLASAEFAETVRRATADDNPFAPQTSLLLQVTTSDVSHAGTDANVTFTLEDTDGQVFRRSVDASYNGRFEQGTTTCVTFPGLALTPQRVKSVTVEHDDSGNAPDWRLSSMTLRLRGAPDRVIDFGDVEIPEGEPVVRP